MTLKISGLGALSASPQTDVDKWCDMAFGPMTQTSGDGESRAAYRARCGQNSGGFAAQPPWTVTGAAIRDLSGRPSLDAAGNLVGAGGTSLDKSKLNAGGIASAGSDGISLAQFSQQRRSAQATQGVTNSTGNGQQVAQSQFTAPKMGTGLIVTLAAVPILSLGALFFFKKKPASHA